MRYENATSMDDILTISNNISDGILAVGLPALVWTAIFAYFLPHGRGHAITTASFISLLIVLVENIAGLVQWWVLAANLVLLALGVFMMLMERRAFEG